MHGQGNYNKQAVQGTHLPPPPFHKNPTASSVPLPPPPFHHGPLPPQRPGIQQGHGSYQLPPGGSFAYSHAPPPGALQHGSPALSGMISGSSYSTAPPPQVRGNNQISHSYPTSGAPWSQNVSQFPQKAPHPAAGTYPLPASQGNITEKGSSHQNPSQNPAPPMFPPYSSSLPTSDPYSSSILAHPRPNFPPLGPLPPPPPLPTHSPPGVPPLPTSSPPSYNLLNNDGGHSSMEDSAYGDNLVLDSPAPTTFARGSSVLDRNEMELKAEDSVAAHSPDDSDMDMEDDITQSDEEKQKNLSIKLHDECISMSKELDKNEHLRDFPHFEGNKVPNCSEHGELISAGSSVSKDQILGAEIRSGYDTSVVCSEADKLTVDVETENLIVVIKESPHRDAKFSQPTVAVAPAESGSMEPSSELKESVDAFKLLEGYATDSSTGSGEHLLGDVTPPTSKVESTYSDVRDEGNFGSESRLEGASEPDKLVLTRAVIKSPRNLMRADNSSSAAGKVEKLADNSHKSKKSAPIECGKSNSARLYVDEFGRLVRKGVSDSDTSDSPRHTRKRERRGRWRSRSRSTSVSPSDRRRRSPRRRRERRGRSRSFSPRRRRSRTRSPVLRRRSRTRSPVLRRRSRTRSPVLRRRIRTRSPVLRRGSDMVGDKNRRDKGQFVGCFDFLKGKCYRGATCRFSHNEPYKSDKVRYNSGKHQNEDTPSTCSNPDFHVEKKSRALKSLVHENISMKDEGTELPKDMPSPKEIKVPEEVPADSTVQSHDKLTTGETASLYTENVTPRHLSGYLSHYMTAGNESSYIQTYPAQYRDKVPRVNPELEKVDKGTESSTQVSSATLTHLPTLKPDREQTPIGQTSSVGSPMTKSYTTEEVPSQLNLPWTSASQDINVSVAQPIFQDYSSTAPSAPIHQKPESYQPYQAPMSYQNPHFALPSNPLSSQVLLPPPPPRPPSTINVSTAEHSIPSLNMHHSSSSHTHLRPYPTEYSSQPQNGQYQAYPSAPAHGQIPRVVDDFTSRSFHTSNVTTQQGIRQTVGEDHFGHRMQGSIHSLAVAQPQSNSLYGSIGVNVPSNTNASQSIPYFQPASYGLQYSAVSGTSILGEPGNLSSSVSRVAGNFLEMGPQSRLHDVVESRISNPFNPYASTFDQPISTKFSSTALLQESAKQFTPMYGTSVWLSSVSDANKIEIVASKHLIPSSSSVIAAEALTTRPGNNQYDPLCDSIEQPSNSLTGASLPNNEIIGDSDNFQRSSGSSKVLNNKNVKQEEGVGISADDSLNFEEYGETADNIEVGDVVNGSPSTPNNAMEIHAGEIEIDQVKASSKKKGKDSRSTNLFKTSIASFVKEVLKPSWRQGNMSKEAFKTIVKKTVDKVSGAMKSHKIPRSQAKINLYIDSSRGKLTKLVMGYVDKYVKM